MGSGDGYRASPSTSGRSTPFFDGGAGRQRTAEELESQNDERLEGLGAKVKMLKDVSQRTILMSRVYISPIQQLTQGIGNEIRESTVQLSQMVRIASLTRFVVLTHFWFKNDASVGCYITVCC